MARLIVYRLAESAGSALVLDVQADLLSSLNTRAVVPLVLASGFVSVARDLNPVFEIEGQLLVMVTQAIATVPTRHLQDRVVSLDQHHDVVLRALDILILGL